MIVLHLEVTTGFRAFSAMLDLQQCRKLEGGWQTKSVHVVWQVYSLADAWWLLTIAVLGVGGVVCVAQLAGRKRLEVA